MGLKKHLFMIVALVLSISLIVGCASNVKKSTDGSTLSGTIEIDGSSTVFPITQAVAEEFMKTNPGVNITVSQSGTGGGFEKWVRKETDLNDASRPIKEEESAAAKKAGLKPIKITVAYDGIAVVVSKKNNFVHDLTVDELKKIWEPNSQVKTWKDVRSNWPNKPIRLYGPGTSSGTFDYFTDEIVGEEGKSRTDFTQSEDDNTLVQGVMDDEDALAYFGFAYYLENKDKLRAVKIGKGKNLIEPTNKTIKDGTYTPLSRPIFMYVSSDALKKKEIKEFLKYYLTTGKALVSEVGYIPLPDKEYEKGLKIIEGK